MTTEPQTLDRAERLLARAAGPGRIRAIVLELWNRGRLGSARAIWSIGLREARQLHSAERRLVHDGLYSMVRHEYRLKQLLGTEEPLAHWLGWLVRSGLPVDIAHREHPIDFTPLLTDWETLGTGKPVHERLSLHHSLPVPVIERIIAMLGEMAGPALRALDERAHMHIRTNPHRGSREALAQHLRVLGIETETLPGLPDGLAVVGRHDLMGSHLYRSGWFEVQDAGSQRVVSLVPEVRTAIDVCAGAGGKSLALAARGVAVTAFDIRNKALFELRRRAERSGVDITTRLVDGDKLPTDSPTADVVLVDAPCTGLGVLRRYPEHRWQLDEAAIAAVVTLQKRLLREASALVSPRGSLVYATCSVLPDENESVIDDFLSTRPQWSLEAQLRTWPHLDDCDGFYAARLRHTEERADGAQTR